MVQSSCRRLLLLSVAKLPCAFEKVVRGTLPPWAVPAPTFRPVAASQDHRHARDRYAARSSSEVSCKASQKIWSIFSLELVIGNSRSGSQGNARTRPGLHQVVEKNAGNQSGSDW